MPEITVPYPNFLADTYIMPDEVNANFAALANQALNRYGGTITGNITVAPGITIDGVDISGLSPTGSPSHVQLTLTGTVPNTLHCPNGGVTAQSAAITGALSAASLAASGNLNVGGAAAVTGSLTAGVTTTATLIVQQNPNPVTAWVDLAAAVDARRTHLTVGQGLWNLYAAADTGVSQRTLMQFTRATGACLIPGALTVGSIVGNITGTVTEPGRTVPMGVWTDVPYDAANFGTPTGAWTVPPANVVYKFAVIGKTLFISLNLNTSVISQNTAALTLKLPAGFTAAALVHTVNTNYLGAAWTSGLSVLNPGTNVVSLYQTVGLGPWPANPTTYMTLNMAIPVT